MTWMVVAFYTQSYLGEVTKLFKSLNDLDIKDSYAESIEDLGSWEANTHYKPTFIRKMLDKFPDRDIVYIDADATVEQYPVLFDNMVNDVAYWLNTWPNGTRRQLASGTLFFKNNKKAREVCDKWVELCKDTTGELEQAKLLKALYATENTNTYKLPVEYCAIFDHPEVKGIEPVIKHYQASRRKL